MQGEPETAFAERLYTYHYKIRDRYQVPVASLAVLADTDQRFRPQQFSTALWDCRVDFRFPMVKLLDYAEPERWAELEASDNVFALVVMAQIRAKIWSNTGPTDDTRRTARRHAMTLLAQIQTQPMRAPDPILAELWEVKRQLNEAAGYRVEERARMAHEATLQVEACWHESKEGSQGRHLAALDQ